MRRSVSLSRMERPAEVAEVSHGGVTRGNERRWDGDGNSNDDDVDDLN